MWHKRRIAPFGWDGIMGIGFNRPELILVSIALRD
jgi:hypothetical protein